MWVFRQFFPFKSLSTSRRRPRTEQRLPLLFEVRAMNSLLLPVLIDSWWVHMARQRGLLHPVCVCCPSWFVCAVKAKSRDVWMEEFAHTHRSAAELTVFPGSHQASLSLVASPFISTVSFALSLSHRIVRVTLLMLLRSLICASMGCRVRHVCLHGSNSNSFRILMRNTSCADM